MKNKIVNILSLIVLLTVTACSEGAFNLNYEAPLTIEFSGVDNSSIVTVGKGVLSYTAKISVQGSSVGVKNFEIYNADIKTGAKGTLIAGTSKSLDDGKGNGSASYSVDYTITGLTDNKSIKVVVIDMKGNVFERNLLVKITASVLFSQSVKIETVEDYYGPYYGTWLDGSVYMRKDGEPYKNEIDLSLGNVVIAAEGTAAVPALVSPAERTKFNLLTISGLQQTKFALTALTKAQYDAITQVDATPIISLPEPASDAVKLVTGKVYLFKTASGKKGLIYVSALVAKTNTIENISGQWVKDTPYHQATITTKVVKG
jgi:hypothetical protein